MPVAEVTKFCTFCGNPAVLMCQRCYDLYCSVQCQTYDWPQHKRNCITMPHLVPMALPMPEAKQLPILSRSASIEGLRLVEIPNRPRSVIGCNLVPNRPMRPPLAADKAKDETVKIITGTNERFSKPPHKVTQTLPATEAESEGAKSAVAPVSLPMVKPPVKSSQPAEAANAVVSKPPALPEMDSPVAKTLVSDIPSVANNSASVKTPQVESPTAVMPSVAKSRVSEKSSIEFAVAGITAIVRPPPVSAPVVKAMSIESTEPKYWLQTRTLTADQNPLEIVVHYVGAGDLIWLIESKWEGECNKLLREINKYCLTNAGAKATPTDVALNSIFAVNFEGAFYRAIVVQIVDGEHVKVRLIDYGNEFVTLANGLLMPSPIMKNLVPFAVKAHLKNAKLVQVESRHLVTVVGHDPTTSVYELKVFEPHVPDVFDMLVPEKEPLPPLQGKVTILALLKKTLALGVLSAVPLKEALQQLLLVLPEKCPKFETCASVAVGDIVCCQLSDETWCRVQVMHKLGDNYVVYGMDSGCFDFVSGAGKFKVCPKDFSEIPAQTVLIEITRVLVDDMIFYKSHCFPFAELSFTMRTFDGENREIVCTLGEAKLQLAEVKIRKYDGNFADLGLPLWKSVAPSNSEVMITDIADQQTLHVCPVDKCGVYRKLFQKLAGSIPAYTKTPKPLELVLATGKSGVVYRARIQTVMSALLGHVIDVDTGALEELEFKHMAPASDFIKALPVYTMLVKVSGVDQFPIEDRILVAEYWKSVVDANKSLILSYEGAHQVGGVKLLNATTKRNFMLDVQEMKAAKLMVREVTPTQDEKRYMLHELEHREISQGEQVKVSLIDVSAVNQGLLTICEFHPDNVMLYDTITKAVNEYGKSQAGGAAYYPKKGELCIGIFPTDNDWYRAVSVTNTSANNPKAQLLFIDYCNTETIDCKNIRKMTADLLMGAVAHLVGVEGLKLPVTKTVLNKMLQWQQKGSFVAKHISKDGDDYVLTMPDMD